MQRQCRRRCFNGGGGGAGVMSVLGKGKEKEWKARWWRAWVKVVELGPLCKSVRCLCFHPRAQRKGWHDRAKIWVMFRLC